MQSSMMDITYELEEGVSAIGVNKKGKRLPVDSSTCSHAKQFHSWGVQTCASSHNAHTSTQDTHNRRLHRYVGHCSCCDGSWGVQYRTHEQ